LQRKDEGEELSPERKGVAAAVCEAFPGGAAAAFAVEIPTALNTRKSTPKIRLALDFISASIPLIKNYWHLSFLVSAGTESAPKDSPALVRLYRRREAAGCSCGAESLRSRKRTRCQADDGPPFLGWSRIAIYGPK
jgi:hypothetical protein